MQLSIKRESLSIDFRSIRFSLIHLMFKGVPNFWHERPEIYLQVFFFSCIFTSLVMKGVHAYAWGLTGS